MSYCSTLQACCFCGTKIVHHQHTQNPRKCRMHTKVFFTLWVFLCERLLRMGTKYGFGTHLSGYLIENGTSHDLWPSSHLHFLTAFPNPLLWPESITNECCTGCAAFFFFFVKLVHAQMCASWLVWLSIISVKTFDLLLLGFFHSWLIPSEILLALRYLPLYTLYLHGL